MATDQAPKKGCLKSLFVGIGCGCLYPAMFVLLIAAIAFFTLADPIRAMTMPPTLPEFSGPDQEHFWSLQEKKLDQENTKSPLLSLTEAEFNAYLTFMQFPPANGVCIHRIRFAISKERGSFFLLSSGFLMRNLVIRIDFSRDEKPAITTIAFNSHQIFSSSPFFSSAASLVNSLLESGNFNPVKEVAAQKAEFFFDDQGIRLTGSLIR